MQKQFQPKRTPSKVSLRRRVCTDKPPCYKLQTSRALKREDERLQSFRKQLLRHNQCVQPKSMRLTTPCVPWTSFHYGKKCFSLSKLTQWLEFF